MIAAAIAGESRLRLAGETRGVSPGLEISETRSRTPARSRARSRVEAYRSSGSLARHRSAIHATFAGIFGAAVERGSRSSPMIADRVWTGVSRWKARFPEAIS